MPSYSAGSDLTQKERLRLGAAGHEIHRYDPGLRTPAQSMLLATATGFFDGYQAAVEEILMVDSMQGSTVNPRVRSGMMSLKYPNGSVFSVGLIAWCGTHSVKEYANAVATVTRNVLRRFGDVVDLFSLSVLGQ